MLTALSLTLSILCSQNAASAQTSSDQETIIEDSVGDRANQPANDQTSFQNNLHRETVTEDSLANESEGTPNQQGMLYMVLLL